MQIYNADNSICIIIIEVTYLHNLFLNINRVIRIFKIIESNIRALKRGNRDRGTKN